MFLCCILYISIRDICEHVNLDATIQYNSVFSIQFWSNHNLASPLNLGYLHCRPFKHDMNCQGAVVVWPPHTNFHNNKHR